MFTHFIRMIKNYKLEDLKNDFPAGLSVAALALPQNMAYALIAGVSPVYGLYTSMVSMIVATFTGVSNYMVVGPTNMISVALASSLGSFSSGNYLEVLLLLTLMVGVIQVVLGILRLGNLITYVSHSVITGLITGAALLIGIGQLGNLLGVTIEGGTNIFSIIYDVAIHLQDINYYSLTVGILTMLTIISTKKLKPELPSYLLGVIVSMLIVYIFGLGDKLAVVRNFSSSLPEFNVIDFDLSTIKRLFSSALSIAILGFIQGLSIIKSLEKKSGQEVQLNQEFISLGIINIICSFFNSFAISGSFTNSFANYSAGARTRISEFITATTIMLFVVVFNPLVKYIPISGLGGLVLLVAFSMVDKEEIIQNFKTTREDAVVFIVTFVTTILSPRLDYAIYFGIVVSIVLVLRDSSDINYSHMSYNEKRENSFSRENLKDIEDNEFIVINLAGNFYFNSSEKLKNNLNESFREDKKFVIRMRHTESIDITAIQELDKFIERVQENGGRVYLCGIDEEIFKALDEFGIIGRINEEDVFLARDDLFSSTKDAIEKAENTG